jgi:hypothetical protein
MPDEPKAEDTGADAERAKARRFLDLWERNVALQAAAGRSPLPTQPR